MTQTPVIISRYHAAAAAGDIDAVVACFTDDAHVHDEDQDHHGRSQILALRDRVFSMFYFKNYISFLFYLGDSVHVVHTHLEGDFPGGVVDLEQRFTVSDGLISELVI